MYVRCKECDQLFSDRYNSDVCSPCQREFEQSNKRAWQRSIGMKLG